MKSLDKKKKQDLEVTDWWNDDKTKKWQEFYNSDQNPSVDHVLERQKKTLDFLKSLKLKPGSKILELGLDYTGVDISNHLKESAERKCFEFVNNNKAKFMLKGDPDWKYDIKKPLFSFFKLKKMFNNNQFKILSKTGATYFIPKNKFNSFTIKGAMFKFFRKLDNMLQFIGDKNLIPYFFTLADNIIILGEKKNVQK